MAFTPAFFEFQLQFAQHLTKQFHLSLSDALYNYTTFSTVFGDDNWTEYVTHLEGVPDVNAWTYQWYLKVRLEDPKPHDTIFHGHPLFGCFYYLVRDETIIRIHFTKNDALSLRPLSHERMTTRQNDLRAMFHHISNHVPTVTTVLGNSWLYNLEAYCRLYPPAYIAGLPVSDEAEFQFLAFWGQCFDYKWNPKPTITQVILENLKMTKSLHHLRWCFPYQALQPSCAISAFYKFYGIE